MAASRYLAHYSVKAMMQLGEKRPNGGGMWVIDDTIHHETYRFSAPDNEEAIRRAMEYKKEFHGKFLGPEVNLQSLERLVFGRKPIRVI